MKINIDDDRNVLIVADWAEVISLYKELANNTEDDVKGRILKTFLKPRGKWAKGSRENDWTGTYFEQMIKWMEKGYEFKDKDFTGLNLPIETTTRKRLRYTDDPEGELDYDQFLNGETEYYLNKPKREQKIGINLRLQYNFAARMDNQILADYAKWIGEVIHHLQSRGYDLQIELYSELDNTYGGTNRCIHRIKMSKFGERVMPRDWSALFSPGGYRHLMFLVYLWPGEITDLRVMGGLGHTLPSKFGVHWIPEERVINVTADSRSAEKRFPSEQMTKELEGLDYE